MMNTSTDVLACWSINDGPRNPQPFTNVGILVPLFRDIGHIKDRILTLADFGWHLKRVLGHERKTLEHKMLRYGGNTSLVGMAQNFPSLGFDNRSIYIYIYRSSIIESVTFYWI